MRPQDLIDEILVDFYKKFNIKHKIDDDRSRNLSRYYNFRLKFIEVKPRNVHISKESMFDIFTSKHKQEILKLFDKIKKGYDLNPHQSRQSFNVDYHDMMFNDWRIHHLHLGHTKQRPKDYFNSRTGDLLFVKFDTNSAYVLNVQHHNDKAPWSNTDLIRIIRNNWNDLLEPFEMGSGKWFPNPNDEEINVLRKKGYSFSVNVDDKTYLMLGDGYASSGDNLSANMLADEVYRWIGKNLDLFNKDRNEFEGQLKRKMHL